MKTKLPPLMAQMCPTCPFRNDSPYVYLRPDLTLSAITEASRICHCTGDNGLNGNTGKPDRLCRGARDVQLELFYRLGVIKTPTDAAWAEALKEINRSCGPRR